MTLTLSKHRIEGLTDGIFAIVMTLLVLELKVPELERHAANREIVEKLAVLGPQFFSFFLTFALAGLFWFQHHSSLQHIRHMTRPLILLNLCFLAFVSLLPFSAGMLGRFLQTPIALQIYYGNQLVVSLLLATQWEVVRRGGLIGEAITPAERVRIPLRLRGIAAACAVALLAAFVQPGWAMNVFAVAAVALRLIGRRFERAAEAAPVLPPAPSSRSVAQ
jgi:uncharacterized membrane protein